VPASNEEIWIFGNFLQGQIIGNRLRLCIVESTVEEHWVGRVDQRKRHMYALSTGGDQTFDRDLRLHLRNISQARTPPYVTNGAMSLLRSTSLISVIFCKASISTIHDGNSLNGFKGL
jgi:hypothetical protein